MSKWAHSSTSAHVDLAIDNNATWSDAFQFGEPDDATWTLNGQTFEMDVRLNSYDETPLLHMTSGGGQIIIDDIIQRVIHFNVDPTTIQTSLSPGVYIYDLIMADLSTPPIRVALMHGKVEVSDGVTG
jgi:hypothetical protein